MAYAEVKGSRRRITGGKRVGLIELGVKLGTEAITQPAVGGPPSEGTSATDVTDFMCVDMQEDPETLPGITFLTSRFEKFVAYS